MLKLAYNTTDSAVLVDSAGYFIGGREWGTVDSTDDIASAELAAGRLVEADEDAAADSGNPLAFDAVRHLRERRDRLEAAKAMDKDELVEALPPEVVDALPEGATGEPAKADLVEAAAGDPSVQLDPVPAKKSTTSSRTAAKK